MARVAASKGYKLIGLTPINAFFIRTEDFAKFCQFETEWSRINVNDGYIVLVTNYDGKYALVTNQRPVYFYGIEDQYAGNLCGDCIRCDDKLFVVARQQERQLLLSWSFAPLCAAVYWT